MKRLTKLQESLKELESKEFSKRNEWWLLVQEREDLENKIFKAGRDIQFQEEILKEFMEGNKDVIKYIKVLQAIDLAKEKLRECNVVLNYTKRPSELRFFSERAEYLEEKIKELEQTKNKFEDISSVLIYKAGIKNLLEMQEKRKEDQKTFLPKVVSVEVKQRKILNKIIEKRKRVENQIKNESEKSKAM